MTDSGAASLTLAADWMEMDDGVKLYLRRWVPQGETHCVLHIVHGMAEHGLRYERLAHRLCATGIEVWAADLRGHGQTASLAVNGADKGGLLGHTGDNDGFRRVTNDISVINQRIAMERREIPLVLMGHSWGSFLVQDYIEHFDTGPSGANLAGCVLSGTCGPCGLKAALGTPFLALLARVLGCRRSSRLARAMVDGPFSKPFRPNRTSFDWLSRDEAEVGTFIRDPLCGNLCSVGFYRDLAGALAWLHKPENLRRIRRSLPVYLFSGSADPVGEMGRGPAALVNLYRARGIHDLEFVLYPGARHETLNETNREEVTENLFAWIESRAGRGREGK